MGGFYQAERFILIPLIRGLSFHPGGFVEMVGQDPPKTMGLGFCLALGKASRIGITTITGIFDTIGETF